MPNMQNGGVPPAASRNQLVGWLPNSITAQSQQTQRLIARFCVSQSLARTLARLAYGEAANDK